MNKLLERLLRQQGENANDYLTRGAVYIGSLIKNEEFEGTGKNLNELLSEYEVEFLKNHLFKQMKPYIDSVITTMKRNDKITGVEDEFEAQIYSEVWFNAYRFNRAEYKKSEDDYSFFTFAKTYSKDCARKVWAKHNNLTDGDDRKKQILLATRGYVSNLKQKDVSQVTAEELHEYMSAVSKRQMTLNDIKKTLAGFECYDYYDGYEEYSKAKAEDTHKIPETEITQKFQEFLDEMRPMQQIIFLHHMGFLTEMSLRQLCFCKDVIEICRTDLVGKNNIVTKDEYTVRRAKVDAEYVGHMKLTDVECINEKFMERERAKLKKNLLGIIQKNQYSEEEITTNLLSLLETMEDKFLKKYRF